MKQILISLSLLLSVVFAAPAQHTAKDSVRLWIDSGLHILQHNAINRDSIDWPSLRQRVYDRTATAVNLEQAAAVFPYIFEQIGDHHGALKMGNRVYQWNDGFSYQNKTVKEAIKSHAKLLVKVLKGNIGYILLPGNNDFSGKQIDRDAMAIREALASLKGLKIKGWILDLRLNTGGSMYQMLAGLAPLLGEGKMGSFINQHGQPDGDWILKQGNIYLGDQQVSQLPALTGSAHSHLPLAVLTSGMTASSGEVVAISTIGRPKSMLIGEPTAGYTTANEGFKINAQAGLNLAVDYDADRNDKVYRSKLSPGLTLLGGDNFTELPQDLKVKTASKWLLKQRKGK